MQRLLQLLFPTLIVLALATPGHANNCASAVTVATGGSVTLTFDATCDIGSAKPSGYPGCNVGDVWFEWVPAGAAGTVHDMNFQITPSGNNTVNIFLLYSESFEATGNACQWSGANAGYTAHNPLQSVALTAGITYNYLVRGVDASGHFFIVVERVNGTGTMITLAPVITATNAVPANDDCNSATVLTPSNGLDPNITAGISGGNWANAANFSTRNATKKRLQSSTCTPPNFTQDHYARSYFPVGCATNGNLGDFSQLSLLYTACKTALMNTTFYKFTVPLGTPSPYNDFNINFSSTTQCPQEPNRTFAMLYSESGGFTCGNALASAQSGSLMACQPITVYGGLPAADFSFTNQTLIPGQTYWIVLDGDRGSQCDLKVLVTRGNPNPLLPVTLNSIYAENRGAKNVLRWETASEDLHDYFSVERSTDGAEFEEIGQVRSAGGLDRITNYTFTDDQAPIGKGFYRLKMVDVNGGSTLSEVVDVIRVLDRVTFAGLVPNPAHSMTELVMSTPEDLSINIAVTDLQGRIIREQRVSMEPGEHRIAISLADMSAGLYLIRLSFAGGSHTEKLIVR
ncbi:MAG: T9SS type A sorting domain-containing protein [Bacteroidia bacterium]|nr:T9SS type A sorting domain-containing protein [Bacteroidia bacterium]